jgi:outer membrane receptor protein involved in Fe transport
VLGTGVAGNPGDFYLEYMSDSPAHGGDTSLTWDKGRHSMLLGVEYYNAEVNREAKYGSFFQALGAPPQESLLKSEVTNLAVYGNDTITWDRVTITPGLRYDHVEIGDIISEDKINPSLGMTYRISEETIVRATVASSFARPYVTSSTGWTGTFGFTGNPDLESHTARSYQAGIESSAIENMHLKADLFSHRLDKTFFTNSATGILDNGGITKKKGFELNATAGPFHNLTTSLGFTYVRLNTHTFALSARSTAEYPDDDFYCLNTKFRYKDRRIGTIALFGQYLWLSPLAAREGRERRYDDMLWDLHYNKEIVTTERTRTDFFFSVRNLFSGKHYWQDRFLNPPRWVEAGLRFHF